MNSVKLSDWLIEQLITLGYRYCYFVAGGNIMHVLNSVRTRLICIPFAHEVGAAIATEYHNASIEGDEGRAFCLVTAGPGLTNAITAVAGAWQESRELLLIGGQVKISDLARGKVRQRGIQEVDGVTLTQSISKRSLRLERTSQLDDAIDAVILGQTSRKGPVFLEIPLDVQSIQIDPNTIKDLSGRVEASQALHNANAIDIARIISRFDASERPVILIGGGVSRSVAWSLANALTTSGIPLMTTFNGADRINNRATTYFGRPNTWGMRYSNILLQQADFILTLGTRLGLQQTGFNWQEFAPLAYLIQVDLDSDELSKGHPRVDETLCCDANSVLKALFQDYHLKAKPQQQKWIIFCRQVQEELPLNEPINSTHSNSINPYKFWEQLSRFLPDYSLLVPCSSGSSFTSAYQAMLLPKHAIMLSNKSQAAMGYGLAGAIGAALANPDRMVFLVEGDGGFLQNLQELVVVKKHVSNLRIFIWVNRGYASIRQTQRNYFQGAWLGCDEDSGLGFPDWEQLFASFGIACAKMTEEGFDEPNLIKFLETDQACAILVPIDPNQTFFPKISSRLTSNGSMESNPLHLIGPPLSEDKFNRMTPFLRKHLHTEQPS